MCRRTDGPSVRVCARLLQLSRVMATTRSSEPVWQAFLEDGSARVELSEDSRGWECRIFSQGQLRWASIFDDVRAAHLEACTWLRLLAADRIGAPTSGQERRHLP